MMKILDFSVLLLSLAASAPSQSISLVLESPATHSEVGVYAGGYSVRDRVDRPSGPISNPGFYQQAFHGTPAGSGSTFARVVTQPDGTQCILGATASNSAFRSESLCVIDFLVSAPSYQMVDLSFSGNLPTALGGSSSEFSVDVFQDGAIEFARAGGAFSGAIRILAGPQITVVRLSHFCRADGPSSTAPQSMQVSVSVSSVGGSVASSVSSMCGPALSLAQASGMQALDLRFLAQGLSPTPHSFFIIGFTPRSLPIPPAGCLLLTDISIPLLSPVFPGSDSSVLDISIANLPGRFYVQHIHAALGGPALFTWLTSNRIEVTIP